MRPHCPIQGYKKVQGNTAYCWQQPRHDPQKELQPSVVEEYGSSEEGTSQWAQQARGSGDQGQHLSSVLKGNIKSNSLKSHLKQQEVILSLNHACVVCHLLLCGAQGTWRYRRWQRTAVRVCNPGFQCCPVKRTALSCCNVRYNTQQGLNILDQCNQVTLLKQHLMKAETSPCVSQTQ